MTERVASRALIVGCGYTGARLARCLLADHDVRACVGTDSSAALLRDAGIDVSVLDLDKAADLPFDPDWLRSSTVCHLVPPPPQGETDPRTARLLQILPAPPACLLYISTTGVYGDRRGDLVTEATPIAPATARARRRADAERRIRAWCEAGHVRCVVLRVPGIYGPGRLPLERLRRGEPVLHAAEAGVGNRIHVDDLVTACATIIDAPGAAGVYNVGDGNHASSSTYFTTVARLAGLPAPRQISLAEAQQELSPQMLSFLTESRRVSTARIRNELGFAPRYTDLEAGIRASLAEENAWRMAGSSGNAARRR